MIEVPFPARIVLSLHRWVLDLCMIILMLPYVIVLMYNFSVELAVRQDNGASDKKIFLKVPHIHRGAGSQVREVTGVVGIVGNWASWVITVTIQEIGVARGCDGQGARLGSGPGRH